MQSFLSELRRRRVLRVAGLYLVAGWLAMQVISVMTPALNLPDWLDSSAAVLLIAGFPVALVLAWALDVTPDGIRRAEGAGESGDIPRPRYGPDIVILIGLLIIGVLMVSGWLLSRQSVGSIVATPADNAERLSGTSIAVLPFSDMSATGDQQYFSDGMAEEILNALANIPDLRVIGRTSSFAFRGRDDAIPDVGRALGVAHILEGSVRKQGDRVRITATLLDAADGVQIWSDSYNGTLENVFELQDTISRAISEELQGVLNVTPDTRIAKQLTDNVEAYDLFLQGRESLYDLWGDGSIDRSIAFFERSAALDPDFTEAWIHIARAYLARTGYVSDSDFDDDLAASRRASLRALGHDPDNATARFYLLSADWQQGNYATAIEGTNRLGDDFFETLVYTSNNGLTELVLGKASEAKTSLQDAERLDPLRGDVLYNLGFIHLYQGAFDQARVYADRAQALDYGAAAFLHAEIAAAEGRSQDAFDMHMAGYEAFGRQFSSLMTEELWALYGHARWLGDADARQKVLTLAEGLARYDTSRIDIILLALFIDFGAPDLFFEFYPLAPGYALPAWTGIWNPYNEGATQLRRHPDFPAFADEQELVMLWQTLGWPDLCQPDPGTDGSDGQFSCR
ncbi:hypothetical protein ACFFUB_07665 [Algimonas porphyrae]|uniref:Tetratricopeptide repeat protein n=1 Tax=Algimonas porphyrae TaxID=1128113 RepID=A0ABQ5V1A8_9PROT|nr:hypothetical protein [Algimonas porphyrae]GLQ20949.1 hypothetical protein GCM10007854_19040 [Algimonas porphyrae]